MHKETKEEIENFKKINQQYIKVVLREANRDADMFKLFIGRMNRILGRFLD